MSSPSKTTEDRLSAVAELSVGTAWWRAAPSAGFAGVAYLGFLAAFGYSVAFVAGAGVPRTVDGGGPPAGPITAILLDVVLLSVFAVQHSVMARPAFKRWWTRLVPAHLERSGYVRATSAVLALVFWQWRPLPQVLWQVRASAAEVALWALSGLGWVIVVTMTFAIDHLDLVGLRQVGDHVRRRRQRQSPFRAPLPHRLVRHPMMTGFFLAFSRHR